MRCRLEHGLNWRVIVRRSSIGLRVQGYGFGELGLGGCIYFGDLGVFRGLGFRVPGLGFRIWDLDFRVRD